MHETGLCDKLDLIKTDEQIWPTFFLSSLGGVTVFTGKKRKIIKEKKKKERKRQSYWKGP